MLSDKIICDRPSYFNYSRVYGFPYTKALLASPISLFFWFKKGYLLPLIKRRTKQIVIHNFLWNTLKIITSQNVMLLNFLLYGHVFWGGIFTFQRYLVIMSTLTYIKQYSSSRDCPRCLPSKTIPEISFTTKITLTQ